MRGVIGRGAVLFAARIGLVHLQLADHPTGPRRHHHDAVRQEHRFKHRMGDEDHGAAGLGPELQQVVVQLVAGDLVQRRKGFVHQDQPRPGHQRPRNRHPHLHAAGQFARIGGKEFLQPDQAQRLHHVILDRAIAFAAQPQRQPDILRHRRPGHQRRFLEHHPKVAGALPARPVDTPRRRVNQPGDQPQRRGFATARRSQQRDEIALPHLQRHASEGHQVAVEDLGDIGQRQDLRARLRRAETLRRAAHCKSHVYSPSSVFFTGSAAPVLAKSSV